MDCPSCKRENPASAKFCQGCGAAFAVSCPSCGAEFPPNGEVLPRLWREAQRRESAETYTFLIALACLMVNLATMFVIPIHL